MTQHEDQTDRVLESLVSRAHQRDKIDIELISRLVARLDERSISQERRIEEILRDLDNKFVPLDRYTFFERLLYGLILLLLGTVVIALVELVIKQ